MENECIIGIEMFLKCEWNFEEKKIKFNDFGILNVLWNNWIKRDVVDMDIWCIFLYLMYWGVRFIDW